ncbi:hypothetical protein WH47_04349 [Habropoda laboriosa]|uniref:SPIN-DOC-like zinc-finger domain-containing protein n=1 Tax=Habropoda laboriosa TaxID=597456 RepID=A0A0L7QR28_9HYME|nr:hypothetical protein WH47_04349 [Habropoda laboriosa]
MPKVRQSNKTRILNRNWEIDCLFCKQNESARCIICNYVMTKIKVFNIMRYYNRFHADQYKTYTTEEKRELLEMYKEQNSNLNERSESDKSSKSFSKANHNDSGKCRSILRSCLGNWSFSKILH